jgi:hypothetical protein
MVQVPMSAGQSRLHETGKGTRWRFYCSGGGVTTNTVPFSAVAAYFSGSLYAYGSLAPPSISTI